MPEEGTQNNGQDIQWSVTQLCDFICRRKYLNKGPCMSALSQKCRVHANCHWNLRGVNHKHFSTAIKYIVCMGHKVCLGLYLLLFFELTIVSLPASKSDKFLF